MIAQEYYSLSLFFRICSSFSRSASSLEAFSYKQAYVSFASLACQPEALPIIWINGSSRTELNYYQNYFIFLRHIRMS